MQFLYSSSCLSVVLHEVVMRISAIIYCCSFLPYKNVRSCSCVSRGYVTRAMYTVFTHWFITARWYVARRPSVCLSVCPSVRPSVTRRYSIETANIKLLSPSYSHTIIDFPRTVWQYSDADPLTARRMQGVSKNRDNPPISCFNDIT